MSDVIEECRKAADALRRSPTTSALLREAADEIEALRAFRHHADARFKENGMNTLTARIFTYPGQYLNVSPAVLRKS